MGQAQQQRKRIQLTVSLDEWELIVRTLDRAYPERPMTEAGRDAYRRYEQLVNKLHKARHES